MYLEIMYVIQIIKLIIINIKIHIKKKDCSKFRSNDNKFAVCKKYERCGDFNENNKKCFISLCNLLLRNELSNEEDMSNRYDR